ncbi:MAG: hypothetical protein P0Y65_15590 [Candidatus Devosia phytovorans]|uniref:Uncharacterized protein n=1 Tax=Candidatus Devosia phytovorans TaxID=3121372 RepID=A0AAJ6AYI0_9HYPH|nr:hypothetical protein [Devosia sp.]WEK03605.1 MAG: hypothetical protein P0Y65_15590 [Devosia sp.]
MRLIALAAVLLTTTPVIALDAITYKGTIGSHQVVVELASEIDGKMVGRYSYLSKGGDIPLTFMGRIGTPVLMMEEAPCTEDTCEADADGNVLNPPMGAIWTVRPGDGGYYLTGTWEPTGKSGKVLDIALERIGQRTLPEDEDVTPASIRESAISLIGNGERSFNPDTAPYEFAKQEVPFVASPEQEIEGSTFVYVSDPRTKFAFPRVQELADGSPSDPVNQALEIRHTIINTAAFDCLSQVYAAFGATQSMIGFGRGTLGDYDSETIEVNYLSPEVISWTESGSTFCGGAHPYNHSDSYNLDVKTGETFPLAGVFIGWVPTSSRLDWDAEVDPADAQVWPGNYYWKADQDLVDFVKARAPIDPEFEEDCGLDETTSDYLAIRFAPGGAAVFRLEGLPHVMGACIGDLMTIKLGDDPELLAPTARDYFPDLAK